MNVPKKLLIAFSAMSVLGSVRAEEIVAQVANPAAPAPMGSGIYFESGVSTSDTFADIVNLAAGAEQRLLTSDVSSRVPGWTLAERSHVADATSTGTAGANATATLVGAVATLNSAIDDVSAVVDPDDFSESRSGTAGWHSGAGFLFSIAEIPEPADWMTLLCGFVVVAFMARRKTGPLAN